MPSYNEDDYGLDVYGQDRDPVVTTHLLDKFPELLKHTNADGSPSNLADYINMHEVEVRKNDADLDYIRNSRQIAHASGSDLNRIGSMFGQLGKRRGRSDDEYRTYLMSLVQSFNARGTIPGLKFAVSAAVNTEPENITVIEDFERNEYQLRIEDTSVGFLSSVVNDVAELADPSGIELASTPVITLNGTDIQVDARESRVIESIQGLSSDAVILTDLWNLK